jgi:hypothetical protein
VGRACWWLTPLYELVLGTVLSTDKVFADETTLPVLEPGKGRTKTGGFGATRSMTGHGQARPIRQQPMSTPRTAGASIRQRTWRHSEAPCRSTVMPGSAIWLMRAGMPRSAWLLCWAHARRPFYEFYTSNQSPLAAGISISKRQVMCLLIDSQDDFLAENREVFRAGLRTVALRANEDETWRCREFRFYLSESLTKSVQQSCCCCEGHAASRSTICWMALSAR